MRTLQLTNININSSQVAQSLGARRQSEIIAAATTKLDKKNWALGGEVTSELATEFGMVCHEKLWVVRGFANRCLICKFLQI